MKILATAEFDRDLLCAKMSGMTRQMCHSVNDAITDVEGPVIDKRCSNGCKTCLSSLTRGVANAKHGSTIPSTILVMRWTQFSFSFPLPYSSQRDWPEVVWQLAWALDTFHWRRGHVHDTLAVWGTGLAAIGDHLADPAVESWSAGVSATPAPSWARTPRAGAPGRRAGPGHPRRRHGRPGAHPPFPRLGAGATGRGPAALEHATRALALYRTLDSPIWRPRAQRRRLVQRARRRVRAGLRTLPGRARPGLAPRPPASEPTCSTASATSASTPAVTSSRRTTTPGRWPSCATSATPTWRPRPSSGSATPTRPPPPRARPPRLATGPPPVRIATPHRDAARIQRQLDNIGEQDRDALVVTDLSTRAGEVRRRAHAAWSGARTRCSAWWSTTRASRSCSPMLSSCR